MESKKKMEEKKRKKIVFWESRITGATGHGIPLVASVAYAWEKRGNAVYPDIIHTAIDEDIPKSNQEKRLTEGEVKH